MAYKIAVASSDGKVVNQHFGRADQFLILDVSDDGKYKAIDLRKVSPICHHGNHDVNNMQRNIEAISDCKYLLVSRIGNASQLAIENQGIRVYVIPEMIDEAIHKINSYHEINQMMEEIFF